MDLSAQGHRVPELAKLFDLGGASVRRYIKAYNVGGLAGLEPGKSPGRQVSIPLTKEEWEELLARHPSQFKALDTKARNWAQPLLQRYFHHYHQLEVTQSTISTTMKRQRISWKRAKKVTSPDPDYIVKRQRGRLTSHDGPQADKTQPAKPAKLVYFDSTDLHWCPDDGQTYSAVGQQVKVETPGNQNPWCALFGSLYFPSGEGLYIFHQRKRHQEVSAHLQELLTLDPDAFYFVILDNASVHTTSELAPFWEQHRGRIEPVFLPTYSPHLNLIERLWHFMRGKMTRNQFYEPLKVQCQEIAHWFATLPFSRFCSLMGIDEADLQLSC